MRAAYRGAAHYGIEVFEAATTAALATVPMAAARSWLRSRRSPG